MAKPVLVSLDGELTMVVIGADWRLDLDVLRRITVARSVELVSKAAFATRFDPCEAGAEPPLGLFGLPIFVDEALAREPWIVMRGGTHEDALRIRTDEWLREEHVRPVPQLGV